MITRSGTHALKALAVLGALPDGAYAGAAETARRIKAPANYLGKLLRQLARAGIVEGRKGANGGFRLARDIADISLFDILEPIEHLTRVKACILGNAKCGRQKPCPLHKEWSKIRDGYTGFLHATKLSEVMEVSLS